MTASSFWPHCRSAPFKYLLLKARLPKFGIALRAVASWLNLFDVPVAFLTPLFRHAFPSFDPNKKTMREFVLLLQWGYRGDTRRRSPPCTCSPRPARRIKQSWLTVRILQELYSDVRPSHTLICRLLSHTLTSHSTEIHFRCALYSLCCSCCRLSCSL